MWLWDEIFPDPAVENSFSNIWILTLDCTEKESLLEMANMAPLDTELLILSQAASGGQARENNVQSLPIILNRWLVQLVTKIEYHQ